MKHFFILLIGVLALSAGLQADEQPQSQVQRTLSIIKPDAVAHNHIGKIIAKLEAGGLKVIGAKMTKLSLDQAKAFYAVHQDRPFYPELVAYMSSGPIFIQVLEGENAIQRNREIMGATDPKKAEAGTIRKEFGTDVQQNAAHGSDSLENAQTEIQFFFKPSEMFSAQ